MGKTTLFVAHVWYTCKSQHLAVLRHLPRNGMHFLTMTYGEWVARADQCESLLT